MICFKCIVDRRTSEFLNICDFVNLRSTCKTHFTDQDAWKIKAIGFPVNIHTLNSKEKIALHYLLKMSYQFTEPIGSLQWYNNIVTWLQHNVSIKIMSSFLFHHRMTDFDMSALCLRRKHIWRRQFHYKNTRLLKVCVGKRKRELVDEYKLEDKYSSKKRLWKNSFLDYPDFEYIETY